MKQDKVYLVMPAYNEEENIDAVINQWYPVVEELNNSGCEAKLVIANDGSKDATLDKLKTAAASRPCLIPVEKPNSGHGATLMHLYRKSINEGADYIFQTDSDGQTNPEEFRQFWEARKDYDLQVGHRSARQDGISRVIVTKVLKIVVWLTFGVSVTDANTPFRLMKVSAVRPVLELIPQDFALSNVALSAISVKKGLITRWIPIEFKPRQGGVNSINLKRILKIGWKAIGDFIAINRCVR